MGGILPYPFRLVSGVRGGISGLSVEVGYAQTRTHARTQPRTQAGYEAIARTRKWNRPRSLENQHSICMHLVIEVIMIMFIKF